MPARQSPDTTSDMLGHPRIATKIPEHHRRTPPVRPNACSAIPASLESKNHPLSPDFKNRPWFLFLCFRFVTSVILITSHPPCVHFKNIFLIDEILRSAVVLTYRRQFAQDLLPSSLDRSSHLRFQFADFIV
ncbi:hypothetical protein LXL04_006048 [Taraxacum kok-saghyz]